MESKIARLKKLLPWWARIAAKIVLSRLPLGYGFWKKLGLFEHGEMDQPAQALKTFWEHAKTANFLSSTSREGFSVLELGPGDSVFTALIAKALGATCVWLVDSGSFATTDPRSYANMAAYLRVQGFSLRFERNVSDFSMF